MNKIKPEKFSKKKLKALILAAQAQQIHNYHFSSIAIEKMSRKNYLGSGVIMTITSLAGVTLMNPTCFKDGLTDKTIECLQAELVHSFELTASLKPKGAA